MITSNHVHLLIKDTGPNVIADSMQLIAGRTAQEYNQRKDRQGAFWEDRYHATAIEADEHLHRCLVYIDLNMVRAIDAEPSSRVGGERLSFNSGPSKRYTVMIERDYRVVRVCGSERFSKSTPPMGRASAGKRLRSRDDRWSEAIAVGSLHFVERVKNDLGIKAMHREVVQADRTYALHEPKKSMCAI